MDIGTKIEVRRDGYRRRQAGAVTRIFTNQEDTHVEYRAFNNGGTYLAKLTDVRLYDRTVSKQKEDDSWLKSSTSPRKYKRAIKDLWD